MHTYVFLHTPHAHTGTSVGSRTLRLWSAVVIATIFEFLGCMLLGGNVTKTLAGGIANTSTFSLYPSIFMYGELCYLPADGSGIKYQVIMMTMLFPSHIVSTLLCLGVEGAGQVASSSMTHGHERCQSNTAHAPLQPPQAHSVQGL
eukprot:jgi/Chrzof1/15178/Cz09g30140.t1